MFFVFLDIPPCSGSENSAGKDHVVLRFKDPFSGAIDETNEILAMTVASIKTLKAKLRVSSNPKSKIQNLKSPA